MVGTRQLIEGCIYINLNIHNSANLGLKPTEQNMDAKKGEVLNFNAPI